MPVTTRAAAALQISEMEAAKALLELKRAVGLGEQPAVASRPRRTGVRYFQARDRDSR